MASIAYEKMGEIPGCNARGRICKNCEMHRSDAKLGVLWALVSRRAFFLDHRCPTWVRVWRNRELEEDQGRRSEELQSSCRSQWKKLSKVRINVEETKIESRKDGEAEIMAILSEFLVAPYLVESWRCVGLDQTCPFAVASEIIYFKR